MDRGRGGRGESTACYPRSVNRLRRLVPLFGLVALASVAATELLPAKVSEFAREVEAVRGRKFAHPVAAGEIDSQELRTTLRAKLAESFPASPEETRRTLVALGLIEDNPELMDRLVDFYASQVIAFYDPEPRRFFVVRGAQTALDGEALQGAAEKLIFTHELTHALQDQALDLDRKIRALKDDGDRALALQCLLEGEATLVMVRAALADLPGADESIEEQLAPLLSPGALEKANAPRGVPDYFVQQLFLPYVEGTAYVRRAVKDHGWKEVDRLWNSPPLSTAEILHPEPRPAPAADLLPKRSGDLAPAAFRPLYSDTIGEWGIRFLLRRGLDESDADAAAAAWRGDRIAFFAAPDGAIAYFWRIRLDADVSAERFESAFEKARRKNPSARAETTRRSGRDVVVACGLPAEAQAAPGAPGRTGAAREP